MKGELDISIIERALEAGEGILRLVPAWVPRSFLMPGGRLKLARQDLYALGAARGGIDERWLASTTGADNGPGTPEDEGLSYIVAGDAERPERVLLKDAIELKGRELLGDDVMAQYGGWPVLAKLFDNLGPIPHHVHQMDEHAARVGKSGKPEAYYFPEQLNLTENAFPYTFFGLDPATTKRDIRECLERWHDGDNGILYHSRAYKLKPGTGWDIPAGILHAPGSLVTYELQKASDVFSMFQSMVEGRFTPWELVIKDVPPEFHHDLDYIVSMLDWEKNIDPDFAKHHYTEPLPIRSLEEMREQGYREMWIAYGSDYFSAKELTVFPWRSVTIDEGAAYGVLVIQGRGMVGNVDVESPSLIRYGELSRDELFVTAAAGEVRVVNTGGENLVMLKHFGPGHPGAPRRRTNGG